MKTLQQLEQDIADMERTIAFQESILKRKRQELKLARNRITMFTSILLAMRKFSIRTLLCLTALIAMLLSAWQYRQGIVNRMVAEHYHVMEFGFRAIECQRPANDPGWLAIHKKTTYSSEHHYRDWLAGIKLDRESLNASHAWWSSAIQHAAIRDHYRDLSQTPWEFWASTPTAKSLPPLPSSDLELKNWWYSHIEPFVEAEALNNEFFTTANRAETLAFNCEVMNHVSRSGGKVAMQKWFALREIVGAKQP
jgi:hypothetical protein